MAFPAEILESSIKIADGLTKGAQDKVIHRAWIGQDVFGEVTYASPITRDAVVDRTNKSIVKEGQFINISATIIFVGDILPNGAAGRREPIDPRDELTLSDGFTGPIIDAPGAVINPKTKRGFIQRVMLGAR